VYKKMSKKKKQWTNKEKFVIALAAIQNTETVADLCQRYRVAASQVYAWKKELLENGEIAFEVKNSKAANKNESSGKVTEQLYAKIGQLTVEKDFLQRALGKFPESNV
jgi:transposase